MHRGRDVITIASALMTNGCDVIASLPVERAAQPFPRQALPRYSILHTQYSDFTFALLHRPQASLHFCTSTPNRSPRINQLLPFELLKGEAGEGAVIDEEDDDAGTGERVGEGNEFRPALQSFR